MTAKRRRRGTIRQLRPGELIPEGEPKRYPRSPDGYVRLRWLVGTQTYVETYEHRVLDGRVTLAEHVHHDNTTPDDNRPENLVELTADEHNALHAAARRGSRKYRPYRSAAAQGKAQQAERRRQARAAEVARWRELYEQGRTAGEIAALVGRDPSNVSRALDAAGVQLSRGRRCDHADRTAETQRWADLYVQGMSIEALAKHVDRSPSVVLRRLHRAGVQMRPRGGARTRRSIHAR